MKTARVLTSIALTVVVACGGTTTVEVEVISPAAAAEAIADTPSVVVIDVRTPEEFAEGHLDGARNIDVLAADFRDRVAELDRDSDYLIYCRSGSRSADAASVLEELGFASVDEIDGGIVAWQGAGLPVVVP
jgi:rhodanese-related sulfurtransferase